MDIYVETLNKLKRAAERDSRALVSYSGGKDSLVTLDLACKAFKEVKCFFMYFVPGLALDDARVSYAKERYGVEVLRYPHWCFLQALRQGAYCSATRLHEGLPDMKLFDVYRWVRADTGFENILTGATRADGRWRRINFDLTKHWDNVHKPLEHWHRFDVFAYLKLAGIPIPDASAKTNNGVDLCAREVLWLHDKHPEDYAKLLEWFPYAEAIVKRREYHGVAA